MPATYFPLSSLASSSLLLTALLALLLDLLLADPEGFPHPVVLVGKLCAYFDRLLNRPLISASQRFARGVLLAILLPGTLTFALQAVLQIFYDLQPYLYLGLRLILVWQLLAVKGLAVEGAKVATALRREGLSCARTRLARIVGRETASLSDSEVIQATVETIAENFSDAVVAPLFFFMLFDLPGMFFYKAVNTLDSMIGYRNARYEEFGKTAARLDDVLNFVPARLAAFFLWLACLIMRLDSKGAFKIFWRDRYQHLSPNAGQTEAVVAGALGIQLGGTHTYHGKKVEKPTIGDATRRPEIFDIDVTVRLLYVGTGITYIAFMALRWLVF